MSIAVIRQQLKAVLSEIDGISAAHAYPPDGVGALPCGFPGLDNTTIEYTAGMKITEHTLQVVVLVERTAGRLDANIKALEILEERFETAMENDADLGNTVGIALIQGIQQETVTIGQTPYMAFVATLGITEKIGLDLN